ncbi:MAG: hypothetical protein LQ342_004497 [Letrouitia transgressa]|nr:MAG: hypothetical protein LQ342_004497 [Letrouitia transgressa]
MAQYGFLFLLCIHSLIAASSSADIKSLFGPSLSPGAAILLPSDANYSQEVTQRWDVFVEPGYIGTIKPAIESDIQNIIQIATRNKISFLHTGGGHGISTTLGRLQNGVDVDLGNFDSVHLDAKRNLLTVGGAAVFSQAIDVLYGAGKELRATLGAGLGKLQGLHGLLIDSLQSVRIITASGRIVTASEKENADLFWGVRGAGFNFGVVTSATYKVYEATSQGQVVNADFLYPAIANQSVWEALESFDTNLPSQLALTAFVLPNVTTRSPLIAINAVYYGPKAQGIRLLEPFVALKPIQSNVSIVPWKQELDAAFFGATNGACVRRNRVNIYSLGLKRTDVATWTSHLNALADFYVKYPAYQGRLLAERFPTQGVLAVPDAQTAYPHRQVKIQLNLEGWYNDSSIDSPVTAFLQSWRAKFQQTSGFADLSVYTGYGHGDEGPEAWYSRRKLGRLGGLKKRWDPKQLFSWYDPILRVCHVCGVFLRFGVFDAEFFERKSPEQKVLAFVGSGIGRVHFQHHKLNEHVDHYHNEPHFPQYNPIVLPLSADLYHMAWLKVSSQRAKSEDQAIRTILLESKGEKYPPHQPR